jgi:hypothetical protein
MSILLTFNGSNYIIPETNEVGWGSNLDAFFTAIPAGCLQKTGGSFTLSAETDFGGAFGLKALSYKSRATNPSTTGIVRLGNTENVSWRDAGNTADLPLSVNASNQLTFNGTQISLNSFTPSRAIVSDGSGLLTVSATTATEVGYLSGVTGAIQTQLGGKVNDTGDTLTGALLFPDGTVGAPSISFSADPDTGFYHSTANEIRISSGGTLQGIIGPLGYAITVGAFTAPAGSVSLPSFTFDSDTNTGMYRIGADDIGLTAAGALRLEITSSANYSHNSLLPGADNTQVCGNASFRWSSVDAVKFYAADGSAGFPTFTFENDTNSGIYRVAADNLGFVAGGVDVFNIGSARLQMALPIYLPDGTAGAPSLTFSTDTNTGIYRQGADVLTIVTGGATSASFYTTGCAILGTTTNDNASAGYVGQYVESVISTGTNFPTSGAFGDLTSISLTAGDWDVTCTLEENVSGATVVWFDAAISTTSGNSTSGLILGSNWLESPGTTSAAEGHVSIPAYRLSLSSTTTVYLKYAASYSVSTPKAKGRISARRMR